MSADKAPTFNEMVRERKAVTLGEAKQYAAALPAEKRRTACGCYTCSAPASACCFPTCLVNFCGGCLMYNPFMCACPDRGTPGAWTGTDLKGSTSPHPSPNPNMHPNPNMRPNPSPSMHPSTYTLTHTLTWKASHTSSCPWTRRARWRSSAAGTSRTRKRPAATAPSGAEAAVKPAAEPSYRMLIYAESRSSGTQQLSSRHVGRRLVPLPPRSTALHDG